VHSNSLETGRTVENDQASMKMSRPNEHRTMKAIVVHSDDVDTQGTDGGLTRLIQNESPGKDKEANWLPAPKGPFFITMRFYGPKEEALNAKSTQPPLKRAE